MSCVSRPNVETLCEQLRRLSDYELIAGLQLAVQGERTMTIRVIHHLNEVQRRKLYLDLGYSSLFDCCVRKLKLSGTAAGRRIQAARCIRRYPDVLALLQSRELSLSTISLVEPVLNDANKDAILERVRGASHREVESVLCEYRPPVALRDRVRPVRVASPAAQDVDSVLLDRECERLVPGVAGRRVLSEQKMFVQFLASNELMELFEEVRNLLSGRKHDMTFAEVLEIVLTEYRDRHSPVARRQRRAANSGATCPDSRRREWNISANDHSRHIPNDVRDEVFTRDGGQCAYVARDGTRCQCRKGLQVDHITPFAAGGTHDPLNLRLLCGAHNRRAAEHTLGAHVMQRFWRRQ